MFQMNNQRNFMIIAVFFTFMAAISGCAGTQVSKFAFNDSYKVNEPMKDEKCYDASVLLDADIQQTKDIAKKVMIALDSKIEEETDTLIKAQRNRHIGLLVGSGGEVLTVQMTKADADKTFVTATTQTGFVGAAGMKAWSCRIVDEMVKMASK